MKLPPFEYACPATLDEAIALLASRDGDAKAISGGQSLMPILAFRLASPSLLVDLKKLKGMDQIKIEASGITLGAKVRWRQIEDDKRLATAHPLLQEMISHVAHYQIRNKGTVGGSIAHADPAAEMPGFSVVCDAKIVVKGSGGERIIPAGEFFEGPLMTVLEADELITEIRLPPWPSARRWGMLEFARRRGDFAMGGVAVFYDLDGQGRAVDAHVGVIGAGATPHRVPGAEAAINGTTVDEAAIQAAAKAIAAGVEPLTDIHASAAYRRNLVSVLLERALRAAVAR